MSRFAFALFGQTAEEILQGLPCKIKDEVTGQFIASTNPADGYEFTIINNNDSSYFVDGLPMSNYSVYAGSDQVPQDELRYKVFLNEEALAHFNDAADTGALVWHHKLNDAEVALATIWSSKKISDELALKATVEALAATDVNVAGKADVGHNHDGAYASITPGAALQIITANILGVLYDTGDLELRSSKLAIKQSFGNESILQNSKTLIQNLELLQHRILTMSSGSGSFYQSLWTNARVDNPPTQTSVSYDDINAVYFDNLTYEYHLMRPFFKTAEMRQAVYYFTGMMFGTGATKGWIKFKCGTISVEQEITSEIATKFGIYLDLTTLADYEMHWLEIWGKVENVAKQVQVTQEEVVLKQAITSLAGETSTNQQNPTE